MNERVKRSMDIRIHSELPEFVMIEKITRFHENVIEGFSMLDNAPAHLAMEALAQLAAMHMRRQTDFGCHAFLLTVKDCRFVSPTPVRGRLDLSGRCQGRSKAAAVYEMIANQKANTVVAGTFTIATCDYDTTFSKPLLTKYFRDRWNRLRGK